MKHILRVVVGFCLVAFFVLVPSGAVLAEVPDYEATAVPTAGCPTSFTDVRLTFTNNTVDPVNISVYIVNSDLAFDQMVNGSDTFVYNTGTFMAPQGEFVIDVSSELGGTVIETLRASWDCNDIGDDDPPPGTRTISAKALNGYDCNDSEWHFVITRVASEELAPATIKVIWANGNTETVSLDRVSGRVAHYVTTSSLDSTVSSATAFIYTDWAGQFNLSHGPC